jgi:hypothetical protein
VSALTAEGERALRRLGDLRGFLFSGLAPQRKDPRSNRLASERPTRRAREQQLRTLREVVIVRAVSILEAYVFDVIETELNDQISPLLDRPESVKLLSDLVESRWAPIQSAGAWGRLLDFCKDGFGLTPRAFPDWQEITLLRETRHAVVHRVGEVTKKYLAAAQKVGVLAELQIDPGQAGGYVYLDDARTAAGIDTCRMFILWFEDELSARRSP